VDPYAVGSELIEGHAAQGQDINNFNVSINIDGMFSNGSKIIKSLILNDCHFQKRLQLSIQDASRGVAPLMAPILNGR
jgi:hypothetical protein